MCRNDITRILSRFIATYRIANDFLVDRRTTYLSSQTRRRRKRPLPMQRPPRRAACPYRHDTSSQVFTTTRRHRTHLYLFSCRARQPCASVCMRDVTVRHVGIFALTLRLADNNIGNVKTSRTISFYALKVARYSASLAAQ